MHQTESAVWASLQAMHFRQVENVSACLHQAGALVSYTGMSLEYTKHYVELSRALVYECIAMQHCFEASVSKTCDRSQHMPDACRCAAYNWP